MDKILVKNLSIPTHIGVTPTERQNPQLLVFDLELVTNIRQAAKTDDLTLTVDYADLCHQLSAYVQASEYQLIETLAENAADFLLHHFPVDSLTLTLRKKPCDLPQIDSVAIVIQRNSKDCIVIAAENQFSEILSDD